MDRSFGEQTDPIDRLAKDDDRVSHLLTTLADLDSKYDRKLEALRDRVGKLESGHAKGLSSMSEEDLLHIVRMFWVASAAAYLGLMLVRLYKECRA